jgi:hypothetical protein
VFTILIYAFMISDPGVHDGVIFAFTMARNAQVIELLPMPFGPECL